MKRQNIIVVIIDGEIELWSNFKKLCIAKGFDVLPYHSLKALKFPIEHGDFQIYKVPVM